ncbi:hypothetical protein SADUNF_Sadunf04G0095900 [Salix dunnii]|uniref:Calponin-homology (CH) domain-containing protein n=1 Tax=Salix dunnii TaxID=1413687 RepID=A0A835KE22_9ROSI|nr:hypothetical protein SADUNF_Sadunf04G0095900 [Salix dunnii]
MTLFTISESEKASYVDQIYSYLGDHPFLKQFLPIYPATKDLFNLVKDGVLLCKLINIVVPGGIDERAVNIRTHGQRLKTYRPAQFVEQSVNFLTPMIEGFKLEHPNHCRIAMRIIGEALGSG